MVRREFSLSLSFHRHSIEFVRRQCKSRLHGDPKTSSFLRVEQFGDGRADDHEIEQQKHVDTNEETDGRTGEKTDLHTGESRDGFSTSAALSIARAERDELDDDNFSGNAV